MTRRIKYTAIFLLLLSQALSGQNSRIMYFMDLPQNRFLNPAFKPSDSLYIGLPVLTGVGFSINNNFVTFSDVIVKGRTDSLITFLHPDYDKERFLSKVRRRNSIDADMIVQLLGFGITLGKGYLFIDINERISETSSVPGELLQLAIRGNESFANSFIDLSSLGSSINYYREAGIGYSRNIGPGLRAGFRAKFLYGIASSHVVNRESGVTINPDFSHEIISDMTLNFSGPVTVVQGAGGSIETLEFSSDELARSVMMKNTMNPGVGLDIGVIYDVTEEVQVSASLTDVGFIKWRNNPENLGINDRFEITGVDVSDVLSGDQSFGDAINQVLDSLQNSFTINSTALPFTTRLPMGLNIGGSYRILPGLSAGLMSHSRFTGTQVHQSVTLSVNYYRGNKLSASLGYTAANHRFDNIGAGVAYRIGVFQFYAASDRIPVVWNRITADEGQTSLLVPANWNTIDLRFGMNLVFGKGKYRKTDECDYWYR